MKKIILAMAAALALPLAACQKAEQEPAAVEAVPADENTSVPTSEVGVREQPQEAK